MHNNGRPWTNRCYILNNARILTVMTHDTCGYPSYSLPLHVNTITRNYYTSDKWSTDCTIRVKLNKISTTLNCSKYSPTKAKLLIHSILRGNPLSLVK